MATCRCGERWDADEMRPDHNGDPICPDCHTTHADQDDHAEYLTYAYN